MIKKILLIPTCALIEVKIKGNKSLPIIVKPQLYKSQLNETLKTDLITTFLFSNFDSIQVTMFKNFRLFPFISVTFFSLRNRKGKDTKNWVKLLL
jgi:hypothetical protein